MPRHKISPFAQRKQPRTCECGQHAWTTLTLGYVTMVSPEDAHLLRAKAWTAGESKKLKKKTVYVRSRLTKLHREILNPPPGMPIDHRNGNGLDNQRGNLRVSTVQENSRNSRRHRDCSSRFKGVSWVADMGMWNVQICVDGNRMRLGYFEGEDEAAKTYDAAALKLFGPFAKLNFPL